MATAKNLLYAAVKQKSSALYFAASAMGYLKRLYNAGTYGNSINAVAQRMIEEG